MTDPPVNDLVGVADAIRVLDATAVVPRSVRLPLADAVGLRLAFDLTADRDHPPFDKAVMDGYAVRAVDVFAGTTLRRVDTVAAGRVGNRTIGPGEAVAIMTGAPLPPGADAVVPVEQTSRDGDRVTFAAAVRPGHSIASRGSDVTAGTIVLPAGTRLGPAQIAVAASVGAAVVSVYDRPTVAVLSTGDELIDVGLTPTGAQIRNSNGAMLIALLGRLGCDVNNIGTCGDDPDDLRAALTCGLRADALFVTGGMSMGERDHVPRLLRELGLDLRVSKLRIKPGKPFVFATEAGGSAAGSARMAFGLPGNPVSVYVCTVRLAARVLRRMAGGPAEAGLVDARLATPLPPNGPREFYLPAKWDGSAVTPLGWKGSADLFTLAHANALVIRPEDAPAAAVGDVVRIVALELG